ncbi:hypothetical protein CONPUDRAFT_139465 [Coniophora puteana RWD-64-598 SS2]|uniref:Up-regulated during septation protein 1 domain-containing protein n=1 Tax=Coniophora puteana (strain RWD-64-598) TaxID=741705 RepID=A0A5M3MC57_CONPW|nr:uncharacterized protein CONPUDRAFT_139465 [Coniophora puteana RWD-64-598 SS2]EIW76789.1 hypothetical protein CONPUDRAFT_139465 [Coniophora puteana RWD-64-598 SS2]
MVCLLLLSTTGSSSTSLQSSAEPRESVESIASPISPAESMTAQFSNNQFHSSVRSILRDPKTPGSGQNVRFFARQRSKTPSATSADNSAASDPSYFSVGSRARSRTPVMELFSPPNEGRSQDAQRPSNPPQADNSNIFDMSQNDVPAIPHAPEDPVQLEEPANSDEHKQPFTSTPARALLDGIKEPSVFSPPLPAQDEKQKFSSLSRSRAMSDSVFSRLARVASSHPLVEVDNDDTQTLANVRSGARTPPPLAPPGGPSSPPDPFRANANTYYTPGSDVPPTPPHALQRHTSNPSGSSSSTHSRSDSGSSSASNVHSQIISLRTQLTLHQSLVAQYEVDLAARDEIVHSLQSSLSSAQGKLSDADKRRQQVRAWRKRVAELERVVRGLEGEVERSREESFERSIMDEASAGALRALQTRISELERERETSWRVSGASSSDASASASASTGRRSVLSTSDAHRDTREVEELLTVLAAKDEEIARLRSQTLEQTAEVTDMISSSVYADARSRSRSRSIESLHPQNSSAEAELEHARAELDAARRELARLQDERESLHHDFSAVQHAHDVLTHEHSTLRAELEAQWAHTERMGAQIAGLRGERDAALGEKDAFAAANEALAQKKSVLAAEVEALRAASGDSAELARRNGELEELRVVLEARILEIEEGWVTSQNERLHLESERDELTKQLEDAHSQIDDLTTALQDHSEKLSDLELEKLMLLNNYAHIESTVDERNTEISTLQTRVRNTESEAESLRAQLSAVSREHKRVADEQSRQIAELAARESGVRAQLEALLRSAAEKDGQEGEELGRARKRVRELEKASADREFEVIQLQRANQKCKEDAEGMNIALDSKQQELELLKRRMGVRGTAGTTPAPAKIASRRESFAPSSVASTPFIRPGSAMSTASETPSVRAGALATSKRVNGALAAAAAAKGSTAAKRSTPPTRASQAQAQAATAAVQRSTGAGPRAKSPGVGVGTSAGAASRRVSFWTDILVRLRDRCRCQSQC